MGKPQLDHAMELATKLAGMTVQFAIESVSRVGGPGGVYSTVTDTKYKRGRIVGYESYLESVVLEVLAPDTGWTHYGATVVLTAKPSPGATFESTPLKLVSTVPISPKRPLIPKFPHPCPRCKEPSLIVFRTVDCSNWRCHNYYLK